MRKALCMLAVFAALPASAGTFGPYDSLYVFGDSLSDSGNLALAAPDFVPSPPYTKGQFTNGDAWTTQLGLTPSLAGGTNFAFGGARAADNGDTIPDLSLQIGAFVAGGGPKSDNALAVIWAGGNDFRDFNTIDSPTKNDFRALVTGIKKNVRLGIRALAASGVSEIVVFGLPDFGRLPEFAGDAIGSAVASGAAQQLNDVIEKNARRNNRKIHGTDVRFFDVNDVLEKALARIPAENAQLACLTQPDCATNGDDYLFFDDIHPVEAVHSLLAQEFERQLVSEVPLPAGSALLLTGLAGFGVWARRRKSQA